jgi:hypothetical protein
MATVSNPGGAGTRARPLYGLLVEFESPEQLLGAAARVRDAGYRRWDCHSPLPLHGMDDAMGIEGTKLPLIVLGAGLTGLGLALSMQYWMNAVNYPLVIGGKPLFSLPANIPITFELTVLLSALAAVIGMLALNRLPEWSHPLLRHPRFLRATSDRFFIVIEARDPRFDARATREFLASLGGTAVEEVEG